MSDLNRLPAFHNFVAIPSARMRANVSLRHPPRSRIRWSMSREAGFPVACSRLLMSLLSFHRGDLLHPLEVLLQGIDALAFHQHPVGPSVDGLAAPISELGRVRRVVRNARYTHQREFSRRTTVKLVTEVRFEACYPAAH